MQLLQSMFSHWLMFAINSTVDMHVLSWIFIVNELQYIGFLKSNMSITTIS